MGERFLDTEEVRGFNPLCLPYYLISSTTLHTLSFTLLQVYCFLYTHGMEKVILKKTSRILAGHLWIFSNELSESPKHYEPGSFVEVYDRQNNFLGIGYINPNSLISIRLLTRKKKR